MKPIAKWSPEFDCWVVAPDSDQDSLFSVPSAVYSETFPISGMTRAGTAYEPPTSKPPMPGSGSSSALPTPRATRGGSGTETVKLLPSPDAYSAERGGPEDPEKRRAGGHSVTLGDVAAHLVPKGF